LAAVASRFATAASTLKLKMLEADKKKHFFWSLWLMLGALLLTCPIEAFFLVLLVGLLKECWDHYYGSGFCLYDVSANLAGQGVAVITNFAFSQQPCQLVHFFTVNCCV
jgi:putative flippase GtrA